MNSTLALSCPACHSSEFSRKGEKNDYFLNQCARCRTLFAELNVENEKTAGEMQELYDHYYDFAKFKLNPAVEMSLQKACESFEPFRLTGKLLDIGFGEGGLLSVAEKNNWECYGTELSPQSLEYGDKKGWKVAKDAFADERFPQNGFDIVTLIELIEHVPNPDDFLQTAYKMLRPGGLLYLTTPNTESINRRWLGIEWTVVSPPEHITLWSPAGMKKALARNDFKLKEIRTEGFNPVEIINNLRKPKAKKSIQSNESSPVAVNRNEAAYALNEAFTSSAWRRAVKSTINRGLTAFRLGDGIKVWAIKKV